MSRREWYIRYLKGQVYNQPSLFRDKDISLPEKAFELTVGNDSQRQRRKPSIYKEEDFY